MDEPKIGDDTPKNRGNAGKGRPKGARNKHTLAVKEALHEAAKQAGEEYEPGAGAVGYFKHLARNKPEVYASLLGKTIPQETQVKGDSENPHIVRIESVIVHAKNTDSGGV